MEKVGLIGDFPSKKMTEVTVKDKQVLIVNDGDTFYATEANCPHLQGKLSRGSLDGTIITCPVHGSQFDAKTGEIIRWTDLTGLALTAAKTLRHPRKLKTYPTSIQEGVLYIEISDE